MEGRRRPTSRFRTILPDGIPKLPLLAVVLLPLAMVLVVVARPNSAGPQEPPEMAEADRSAVWAADPENARFLVGRETKDRSVHADHPVQVSVIEDLDAASEGESDDDDELAVAADAADDRNSVNASNFTGIAAGGQKPFLKGWEEAGVFSAVFAVVSLLIGIFFPQLRLLTFEGKCCRKKDDKGYGYRMSMAKR